MTPISEIPHPVGIPPNRGDIVYEEALCRTHDAGTTRSSGPVLCGSSGRREGRSLRSPAISGSVRAPLGTGSRSCSTNTEPPCATNQASGRSQQRPCCVRSAIPTGSTASPSSPAAAAPAPWRCHRAREQATPSSTGSTSEATGASPACSTSRGSPSSAASPTRPPTSPAKPPKPRPDAKPDEPTSANSPTGSSAACRATKPADNSPTHQRLDKGASDSPESGHVVPIGPCAPPRPGRADKSTAKARSQFGQRLRLAQTDRHTTIMSVFGAHDAVGGSVRRRQAARPLALSMSALEAGRDGWRRAAMVEAGRDGWRRRRAAMAAAGRDG